MDTQTFLSTLRQTPDKPLVFDYGQGKVEPGYHVTEVMNVTFETVDCSGQTNFWRETVIQLQGPSRRDKPEFMSADKFLSIYDKVSGAISVHAGAEIRIEYGDAETPALHYHVGGVSEAADKLVVSLTPPGVTCKARDRLNALPLAEPVLNMAESCCTPSDQGCC